MVLPRRVHCLRAGRGSPVPRSKAPHDAVAEGAAKPRFSEHRRRAEIASHPGKHVMPALTGKGSRHRRAFIPEARRMAGDLLPSREVCIGNYGLNYSAILSCQLTFLLWPFLNRSGMRSLPYFDSRPRY